jgi:hypothetical protein
MALDDRDVPKPEDCLGKFGELMEHLLGGRSVFEGVVAQQVQQLGVGQ